MAAPPKILIGIPTYFGKNYCVRQFLENLSKIDYPKSRLEVKIFDNSPTPENAEYLNKTFGVAVDWKNYTGYTIFQKLADTHERIRLYALDNGFDYLFHLESDLFPEPDIIWTLLRSRKPVIGAPYMIGRGAQRHLITRIINLGEPFSSRYANAIELGHTQAFWMDGSVKPCLTNGLGCTLIRRDVLKNFKFRYEDGANMAPDSFFSLDLYQSDVRYWVDTSLLVFHWNDVDWGAHAKDLKISKTEYL